MLFVMTLVCVHEVIVTVDLIFINIVLSDSL